MNLFTKKKEVKINNNISDNILDNAISTMTQTEEIETAVEGKTIKTLSTNGYGIIIRFTDGTVFKSMNGTISYDGIPNINMKFK